MNDLAKTENQQQALQTSVTTPDQLLAMAVQQGADLDKLEKLMQLQERWEANEAKKAFNVAVSKFKENPPKVVKDKENTQYGSMYTTAGNLINTVNPALSEFGLRAHWEIDQTEGVKVTCILTHIMGHNEQTSMSAPPDTSGSKNAIQQIKSTITYLKVATYEAITGLASYETNDDGNGSGQMNPEPLRMGRVADAYKAFKEVIDADVDVMDHQRVQEGWSRLTNDEQIAVHNMFGGDKPEGCKKGYKAIVKELLQIKGE